MSFVKLFFFINVACLNSKSLTSLFSTQIWRKPSDTLSHDGSSARLCLVTQTLITYGCLWEIVWYLNQSPTLSTTRDRQSWSTRPYAEGHWLAGSHPTESVGAVKQPHVQGSPPTAFLLFPRAIIWREARLSRVRTSVPKLKPMDSGEGSTSTKKQFIFQWGIQIWSGAWQQENHLT